MEKSSMKIVCLGLVLTTFAMISFRTADAQMGACYGTLGNNLPSPREMIDLCKQHNIHRIRLYDPNPTILEALQGSNISVMVGVVHSDIQGIARDPSLAKTWVQNNVLRYQKVNFRCIVIGNEITPSEGDPSASIAPSVPTAMQHISDALSEAGHRRVKVSTSLSMNVIAQSYPPSSGAFKSSYHDTFIDPIIKFLVKTKGPFLINVYPYFAYASDPSHINLDYALFAASPSVVVKDGAYRYHNLFDAMVDAVHVALEKADGANLEIVVSETGWPSAGGTATTVANARTYNSNLIKSVKRGTPRRPIKPIETYIFDLIDENNKSPQLEKNWGIFLANKSPKYPLPIFHSHKKCTHE